MKTCVPVYLCICVPVWLCVCVPVYLCDCVPVYLCTCVTVYLCTCVTVYLCDCVPVYMCTCVPMWLCTCVPVWSCHSALLRKFQTNGVEQTKTHTVCSNFFPPENHAVCEKMWKNTVDPGRPQMKIWRIRIDWIPKATNTHSEYAILIVFPLQQWWHQRATKLRLCITCRPCWFVILLKPEIESSFIQTARTHGIVAAWKQYCEKQAQSTVCAAVCAHF